MDESDKQFSDITDDELRACTVSNPSDPEYQRGRAEAEKRIADGDFRLLRGGHPGAPWIDETTGLPLQPQGCFAFPQMWLGHNDRIVEYVKENNINASRLQWKREIDRPIDYFDENKPLLLQQEIPYTSPDDRFTLRLVREEDPEFPFAIAISSRDREAKFYLLMPGTTDPSVEFLWGPPGSDTIFLKFFSETTLDSKRGKKSDNIRLAGWHHDSVDLRTGKSLSFDYISDPAQE